MPPYSSSDELLLTRTACVLYALATTPMFRLCQILTPVEAVGERRFGSQGSSLKPGSLAIDRRFCGPPESGNGGYVCGRLAGFLAAAAVSVRLHVPPPLETPLEVRPARSGADLYDGDLLVAQARAKSLALEAPEPPEFEAAEAAALRFRGFGGHWFPTCFVCGPERQPDEGLRIFPGPVEGRDLVAAPWIPSASLAPADGPVPPEFLWAALDCPGAFAFPEPPDAAVLLGELQVELFGDVRVGERCVLVAWELAREGRKHHTGTALFGEGGVCRGLGVGTWIEVALDAARRERSRP